MKIGRSVVNNKIQGATHQPEVIKVENRQMPIENNNSTIDLEREEAIVDQKLAELKDNISNLIASRLYKKARTICEKVVNTAPIDGTISGKCNGKYSEDAVFFLRAMCEIKLISGNAKEAIKFYKQSESVRRGRVVDNSEKELGVRCYIANKEYEDALEIIESWNPNSTKLLDWTAYKAECLFETGKHNDSANMLNSAISFAHAEANVNILVVYAYVAFTYKKVDEALRALLKSITVDQNNKRARALLAQVVVSFYSYNNLLST
jgi:tetratricopeptide (TPR) repeat protein